MAYGLNSRLEDTFSSAVDAKNEKDFYVSLFIYLSLFEIHDSLKIIAEKLNSEANNDLIKGVELGRMVRSISEDKAKYLLSVAEKSTDIGVRQFAEELKEVLEGRVLIADSDDNTTTLERINRLLLSMYEGSDLELKEIAKGHGIFSKEGLVIRWNWCKDLNEYEEVKRITSRLCNTAPWYWLRKLIFPYEAYKQAEQRIKEAEQTGSYWDKVGWSTAIDEIESILKGKSQSGHRFIDWQSDTKFLRFFHPYIMTVLVDSTKLTNGDSVNNPPDWPENPRVDECNFIFEKNMLIGFKGNRNKVFKKLFDAAGGKMTLDEINTPEISDRDSIGRTIRAMRSIISSKANLRGHVSLDSDGDKNGASYWISYVSS